MYGDKIESSTDFLHRIEQLFTKNFEISEETDYNFNKQDTWNLSIPRKYIIYPENFNVSLKQVTPQKYIKIKTIEQSHGSFKQYEMKIIDEEDNTPYIFYKKINTNLNS